MQVGTGLSRPVRLKPDMRTTTGPANTVEGISMIVSRRDAVASLAVLLDLAAVKRPRADTAGRRQRRLGRPCSDAICRMSHWRAGRSRSATLTTLPAGSANLISIAASCSPTSSKARVIAQVIGEGVSDEVRTYQVPAKCSMSPSAPPIRCRETRARRCPHGYWRLTWPERRPSGSFKGPRLFGLTRDALLVRLGFRGCVDHFQDIRLRRQPFQRQSIP